jgi:hypothetical protein
MLAALKRAGCVALRKNSYIIYQTIYPEHLYRLAGLRSWDQHGPKYTLGADGQPSYVGHFDDDLCRRWICTWVARQLEMLLSPRRRTASSVFGVDDALLKL